jgi:hypothetical protein
MSAALRCQGVAADQFRRHLPQGLALCLHGRKGRQKALSEGLAPACGPQHQGDHQELARLCSCLEPGLGLGCQFGICSSIGQKARKPLFGHLTVNR